MHTELSAPQIALDLEPLDPDGPPRAPVISVCASKGGAGKSTLASNIAAQLGKPNLQREQGLRVLAIDAEPQGHLADNLGAVETDEFDIGDLADALEVAELDQGTGAFEHLEHHFATHPLAPTAYENVHLLRGGLELVNARHQVNGGGADGELWLATICEFFGSMFDVIVIDSPPVLNGTLGIRAVFAADLILSPVICDEYQSIKALDQFFTAMQPLADGAPILPVAIAPRMRFNLWKSIDAIIQEEGRDGYLQQAAELVASVTEERHRKGPWLAISPYDAEVSKQGALARPIAVSPRGGSLAGTGFREAAERALILARRQVEAA
jgi:cellulose biosynthesis protein BcsQ